jgi:hypothetical protein
MKTISDKTFDVAGEAVAQVVLNLTACMALALETGDREAQDRYAKPLEVASTALLEFVSIKSAEVPA